jgi:hypothetical protein
MKGYPLSPIQFCLVVEGLGKSVISLRDPRRLRGIKIGRNCILTHLIFEDDVLLFGNGYCNDSLRLKEVLDMYMKSTRMEINGKKIPRLFYWHP